MAQLRDAISSQFLAEGTPLEVALLAQEIGFDEVIFDDVGVGFDPQALIAAHAEVLTNVPEDAPEAYKEQLQDQAEVPAEAVAAATGALADARAAVDNA